MVKAINNVNINTNLSILANNNYLLRPQNYLPWDLSHIKSFTYREMGHYISLYGQKQVSLIVVKVDLPKAVLANIAQVFKEYYQTEKK